MNKDTAGTLRKLTLDGVSYDVMADTNVTEMQSSFESSSVPTSGRNMRKMTGRATNREGVVIACNDEESVTLKATAENRSDIAMSYTTASGGVFRSSGWIEFENRETEENRAAIQLHPRKEWTPFS